jgi:hypothetical protein
VPVTVYVVVDSGETVIVSFDIPPGVHRYEAAPVARREMEVPLQMVSFTEEIATTGFGWRVITTSSAEEGHPLLLMVHRSVLIPTPIPVTPEVGEEGSVMVAVPEMTVHVPVPVAGAFAANVVVDVQMSCALPAFAVVGLCARVMTTSSEEEAQPWLLIVHRSVLIPTPIPVTPEAGEEGFVMVAVPEITVHAPVPVVGVFAARAVVSEQIS